MSNNLGSISRSMRNPIKKIHEAIDNLQMVLTNELSPLRMQTSPLVSVFFLRLIEMWLLPFSFCTRTFPIFNKPWEKISRYLKHPLSIGAFVITFGLYFNLVMVVRRLWLEEQEWFTLWFLVLLKLMNLVLRSPFKPWMRSLAALSPVWSSLVSSCTQGITMG